MITGMLQRASGRIPQVTNMELFFDLVYVFAISQLSALLAHNLNGTGVLKTLILFGTVWWVWNYTTWATNWVDPDRLPVRIFMVVLMGLSLVMSAAIPAAFDHRGLQFALAVVVMQVGRPLFMIVAMRGDQLSRNYVHLLCWSGAASVLWIAGACTEDATRLVIWLVALIVDVIAPALNMYVPGLGSTPMSTWRVEPAHLVERYQLIFIIALGEAVVALGREFSDLPASWTAFVSLLVGFAITVAFWWLYFARHSGQAEERLDDAEDRAARARGAYAYSHAILVAGIIVSAVGAEMLMAEPREHTTWTSALAVAGGPMLFLLGVAMFVRASGGVDRLEAITTLTGLVTLAVILVIAKFAGPPVLATAALVMVVLLALVGVAAWHARPAAADGPVGDTAPLP